jgi:cobalamin biosynthesis protein CobT
VIGFAGRASLLKSFSEPWTRFAHKLPHLAPFGGTRDYEALAMAHKLLRTRSEQRRVVFSLTDGLGDEEAMVAQIKTGERLGIPTIGVGIGYDVQSIYGPNSVQINSVEDLASVALKQIKLAA